MQLNAYAVYDAKALCYGVPFFAPTNGSAIRSFAELSNDLSTTVGRYPTDFALWCIGTYDDQTGQMTGAIPPVHVIDANACVRRHAQMPLFTESAHGPNGGDPGEHPSLASDVGDR